MVERHFGAESVADINRMTALSLERDLLTGALNVPPTLLPPDESAASVQEVLQLARR